jgi:hypothetical protein
VDCKYKTSIQKDKKRPCKLHGLIKTY